MPLVSSEGVEVALDREAEFVLVALEEVEDREAAGLLRGVVQVVDADDIGEEVVVEARVVAELAEDIVHPLGGADERGEAAELGGHELHLRKRFLDDGKGGVVEGGLVGHGAEYTVPGTCREVPGTSRHVPGTARGALQALMLPQDANASRGARQVPASATHFAARARHRFRRSSERQ